MPSLEYHNQMPSATDFFVSYNHHDQIWAEWIAWQLEDAGYSALIQSWDFRPGSNFVIEMQSGLSSANRMIIVLSGYFLKSDFTAPEWAAVFAQDPRGSRRKLVPVRVSDCEPTGLLTSMVYVDLVDKVEVEAREALLSGVRAGRAKPSQAPRFPRNDGPVFPRSSVPSIEQRVAERARFTLVLTGTIDSLDKPLVEAILEHLKKVSSDASMTLIRTEQGSVRLILECSPAGLERLKNLFQSGQLIEVGGLAIEAMFEQSGFLSSSGSELPILPSVGAMIARQYADLRGLAASIMARVSGQELFDETSLVNEVVIRLQSAQNRGSLSGFAPGGLRSLITRTMRNILIDSSRTATARRSGQLYFAFDDPITDSERPLTLLMIDEALAKLTAVDAVAAEIVELYYFGEQNQEEIGKILGITTRAVFNRRRRAIMLLRKILANPQKRI